MSDPDEIAVESAEPLDDAVSEEPQSPAAADASEACARRVTDLGWDEARIAQARATFLALADAWDDPDLDVYNDV